MATKKFRAVLYDIASLSALAVHFGIAAYLLGRVAMAEKKLQHQFHAVSKSGPGRLALPKYSVAISKRSARVQRNVINQPAQIETEKNFVAVLCTTGSTHAMAVHIGVAAYMLGVVSMTRHDMHAQFGVTADLLGGGARSTLSIARPPSVSKDSLTIMELQSKTSL